MEEEDARGVGSVFKGKRQSEGRDELTTSLAPVTGRQTRGEPRGQSMYCSRICKACERKMRRISFHLDGTKLALNTPFAALFQTFIALTLILWCTLYLNLLR